MATCALDEAALGLEAAASLSNRAENRPLAKSAQMHHLGAKAVTVLQQPQLIRVEGVDVEGVGFQQ